MNSNIFEESNIKNINSIDIQTSFNAYRSKENEMEKDDLKNLRIETTLSLRKKKLNDYLFSKRKKELLSKNNKMNENDSDDNDLSIDIDKLEINIPEILIKEFDIYDEKLSIIHQFLTNDFSLLNGVKFVEEYMKQYMIYKLQQLTYNESQDIYDDKFKNDLKLVFQDLINMIEEYSNDKTMLFGITTSIVNILYYSELSTKDFIKTNIWKRLAEITDLKIPALNDNISVILLNAYHNDKSLGKDYILSNYSRYIKQIISNLFKTFINDSKNDSINLKLYINGITLITKMIDNENKEVNKTNDFDIVIKMKFIYDYLTKIFIICSSWILNNIEKPKHEDIYKFLLYLLNLFSSIATHSDEETYEMQEFRGESFVTSFCSLLKYIILNNEKKAGKDLILSILNESYNFIAIFFNLGNDKTSIYSDHNIIIITEELIKNINLMPSDLGNRILFFLSNYEDSESRIREIFEQSNILSYIKDYSEKNIYNNKISYNVFYVIDNGFCLGNNNCKDLIVNNFSHFLIERLKLLSDIKEQSKIKIFAEKCGLLNSFIDYSRNNSKLQMLKNLLDEIKKCDVELIVNNVQLLIKEDGSKNGQIQNGILESFLDAIKK